MGVNARALRMVAISGCTVGALAPVLALAQETEIGGQAEVANDIVVTGTLLRGADVVGSSQIGINRDSIEREAPISTNEILASVPQVSNFFNNVPAALIGGSNVNQVQITRPNLRNLSTSNASSSATLILVDGHRIASAGVTQASVDPDAIPIGAIERVDVVTEGGSATYGADAVAGVINFITLRDFDGFKAGGHYGFADNYWQWDANATVGKKWDGGSVYISGSYSKNGSLFGRDRSFIRSLDYSSQPYRGLGTQCAAPNLTVNSILPRFGVSLGSVNYGAPGYIAGTSNRCDNGENGTAVPEAERIGVLAGLGQELDSRTRVDIKAFFSRRETKGRGDYTGTVAVGPTNPYASSLPAGLILGPTTIRNPASPFPIPVVNQASVSFNLSPLLGESAQRSGTLLREWGANAELAHDLSDDWQVRALVNWSGSNTSFYQGQISNARLAAAGLATTTATAFNPFDVTRNNPAVVSDLIDSQIAGQSKDNLFNTRLIAEGKLFALPGGDVRLAVGYEFIRDDFQQRYQNDVRVGQLSRTPYSNYSRNVHSAFGELRVPLIAAKDGGDMLALSAAARYDHYSDFGDTFNPKIGASFRPTDWITVRGNWGTSFTAPTPLDQLGSQRNTITSYSFVPFSKPGETAPAGSFALALQGSVPDLKPQKADTWSIGADVEPIDGLRASANYYSVKFKDLVATPAVNSSILTNYPNNILTAPSGFTRDQILAFGALAPGGIAVANQLIQAGVPVYELVDFRVANYGSLKVTGIDFNISYQHPFAFGSIDASVSGNRPLSRKTQVSSTASVVDALATDNPKLLLQASLGTDIGHFRASVTLNHNSGYDIAPTPSIPVQDHVGVFDTVDLFFKYDIPGSSAFLKGMSLTLNVNNIADEDPPVLFRNFSGDAGYANGFTLGRMFNFGIAKAF